MITALVPGVRSRVEPRVRLRRVERKGRPFRRSTGRRGRRDRHGRRRRGGGRHAAACGVQPTRGPPPTRRHRRRRRDAAHFRLMISMRIFPFFEYSSTFPPRRRRRGTRFLRRRRHRNPPCYVHRGLARADRRSSRFDRTNLRRCRVSVGSLARRFRFGRGARKTSRSRVKKKKSRRAPPRASPRDPRPSPRETSDDAPNLRRSPRRFVRDRR